MTRPSVRHERPKLNLAAEAAAFWGRMDAVPAASDGFSFDVRKCDVTAAGIPPGDLIVTVAKHDTQVRMRRSDNGRVTYEICLCCSMRINDVSLHLRSEGDRRYVEKGTKRRWKLLSFVEPPHDDELSVLVSLVTNANELIALVDGSFWAVLEPES